jgi:pimeloyl-ACP methyl ester carboxylesterase
MRFDYYGSGDSAGGDTDGSVRQWRDDVGTAIEELRDIAGLRSVGLIGVRLGAPLAVACAADRKDVDRLVLWDPVYDGSAYVHEITGNGSEHETVEARGFLLTAPVRSEMRAITLEDFRQALPRTLIVSTVEPDTYGGLEQTLLGAKVDVTTAHCPGPQVWEEEADFAAAGMPVAALEEIARWMSE